MHEHGENPSGGQGFESTDIQLRFVMYAGIAVVILTFLAYIVSTFVVRYVNAQPPVSDFVATPIAVENASAPFASGVRLQVDAPNALGAVRKEQDESASTFGVVSDEPEIYRIPVNTAIDVVAEHGLPEFPKIVTEEPVESN